jgi:hypothetical protein
MFGISNKHLIFILTIMILLILVYLCYKYYFSAIHENFDELGFSNVYSNTMTAAVNLPSFTKWTFPNSKNHWYAVKQSGFNKYVRDMGFSSNINKTMSLSFFIQVNSGSSLWRNVFHFTDSTNSDSCRIPAMWIFPDNTTNFHIRFRTSDDNNNGINTQDFTSNISFGNPYLLTLVFKDNQFTFYINNTKVCDKGFNNIAARDNNTLMYIGNPWYASDNGILISNFTVYDGSLTQSDVNSMVDKVQQSPLIAGPPGKDGPSGPTGKDGAPGTPGPSGGQGSPGSPGTPGTNGLDGKDGGPGPSGPPGSTGEKGGDGPPGPQGAEGKPGGEGVSVPGPMGAPGSKGDPGPEGPAGPVGGPGANGPPGSAGQMGPEGPAGPVGGQGPIGPMGPIGLKGDQGIPGEQGIQGEKGSTGDPGPAGPLGPEGIAGKAGEVGAPGTIGPAGSTGDKGDKGDQGIKGDAGMTGPVGSVGPNGRIGDVGPPGGVGQPGGSVSGFGYDTYTPQ